MIRVRQLTASTQTLVEMTKTVMMKNPKKVKRENLKMMKTNKSPSKREKKRLGSKSNSSNLSIKIMFTSPRKRSLSSSQSKNWILNKSAH